MATVTAKTGNANEHENGTSDLQSLYPAVGDHTGNIRVQERQLLEEQQWEFATGREKEGDWEHSWDLGREYSWDLGWEYNSDLDLAVVL
jgi:hypothetical protein